MKKQNYTLSKEIPVIDWKTKEFVRNLQAEDLDGRLYLDIENDNVAEVMLDDKKKIVYTTLEGGGTFVVQPGWPAKLGFLGRFEIVSEILESLKGNWQHYAAQIAVNLGTQYIDNLNIYRCAVDNSLWEIAEPEKADNCVTIFLGEEEKTFHFRRIWAKERDERGLPAGKTL